MAHGGEHDSRLRRRAPEKTNGMNPLGSETGMSWKLQEMFMEKIEAPGISSQIRQALQSFLIFLHQFSAFSCSRRFPPIRSTFYVNVDSEPGIWRCPSMSTGISIRMRFSVR